MVDIDKNDNEKNSHLLLLPQILSVYDIPHSITITQNDIDMIKNMKDTSFGYEISCRIESIEAIKFNFHDFQRERQLKSWLILLMINCINEQYNITEDNNQLLLNSTIYAKLLQKLYHEQYFTTNDILIIMEALLAFGFIQLHMTELVKLRAISSFHHIKLSFKILNGLYLEKTMTIQEQDMLTNYLTYFDKLVLNNNFNINLIYTNVDILFITNFLSMKSLSCQLNEELTKTIHSILLKVFIGKYDQKINRFFLNDLKSSFINFQSKSLEEIYQDCIKADSHIKIIGNHIQEERVQFAQTIRQGFFFTNSPESGIQFKTNSKLTDFTLLFSFQTMRNNINDITQTLLSFKTENMNNNILTFMIEYGRLIVLINKDEKQQTQFIVQKDEAYTCLVTCSKSKRSGTLALSIYCNGVLEELRSESKMSYKDTINCYIGFNPTTEDHFTGEIGTIIFFNEVLSDKIIEFLKDLNFEYDKLLYLGKYDQSFIEQYEIFNSVYYNMISYNSDLYHQRKKDFFDKIDYVISQKAFSLSKEENNKTKVSYRHNFLDFKPKEETSDSIKIKLLAPFSLEFFPFEKKYTLVEFIKLNGIQFLSLHLEYYYQLLNVLTKNTDNTKNALIQVIWNNIENIFKFVNNIVNDQIHLFKEDFKQFFSQLFHTITLLYKSKKLTKGILGQFTMFLNKLKRSQLKHKNIQFYNDMRNSVLFFLMDYDLYDSSDIEPISDLFSITLMTFQNEKNYNCLINQDMFNQILAFTTLLHSKHFNKINLKTYLEVMTLFLISAFKDNKTDLTSHFFCFVRGISNEKEILYSLFKILYIKVDMKYCLQKEYLNTVKDLYQMHNSNDFDKNNKIEMSSSDEKITAKLSSVLGLVFLDIYDLWFFPEENSNIQLHYLFITQKIKLSMIKAIITGCIIRNKEELFRWVKNKNPEIPEKTIWDNNNAKIVYYISIAINLFISDLIDETDIEPARILMMNCLISLSQNNNESTILSKALFGNKSIVSRLFLHHCIQKDNKSDSLFVCLFLHILENSQETFIFKFLSEESSNPNGEHWITNLIPQVIRQLESSVLREANMLSLSNIINLSILVYHMAQSLRFEVLINNDFNLIIKLIEILTKTNLIYSRIEVSLNYENDTGPKKLICELLFEIIISLYVLITEEKQSQLLAIFDSIFLYKQKQETIISIPSLIDNQMSFNLSCNKPFKIKTKELDALQSKYTKNETSIILLFIVKAIIYKNNLCANDEEIFYTILYNKMSHLIKILIDQSIILQLQNKKFKETKWSQKYDSIIKNILEISQEYQYEEIEKTFIKQMYPNKGENEENSYMYNKIIIFENITIEESLDKYNKQYYQSSYRKSDSTYKNNLSNSAPEELQYNSIDLKNINHQFIVRNPKKYFLKTVFSTSYYDVFFSNEEFLSLKQMFINTFTNISLETKKIKFPTKYKNYSNGYYPPLFLKQDQNFFDETYFPISHEYYMPHLSKSKIQTIPFIKRKFKIISTKPKYVSELVTIENSYFGEIQLKENYLLFESGSSSTDPRFTKAPRSLDYLFSSVKSEIIYGSKQISLFYSDIDEIIIRRFLLMDQALEIYLKNGKSYFFNLYRKNYLTDFLKELDFRYNGVLINDCSKEFQTQNYTQLWHTNKLSTFEYLLYLNKYAKRTFQDVNQYPILPWLLYLYEDLYKPKLRKKDEEENSRKFNYPISIRNKERLEDLWDKYQVTLEASKSTTKFGYHFGNHYSTAAFIYYYLIRVSPYTQASIKLQSKSLDSPNRIFYSFKATLNAIELTNDNRELIPQFFSTFECFLNLNCINLGQRNVQSLLTQVDDMKLLSDKSLSSFADFIRLHLAYLNMKRLKSLLPAWIDYTFGINQLNKKEDSCNIFPHYTYEKIFDLEKELEKLKKEYSKDIDNIKKKIGVEINSVINFGQTPYQVLRESSLQKKGNKIDDELEKKKKLFSQKQKKTFERGIIYFELDEQMQHMILLNNNRNIEYIKISSMKKKLTFNCQRFKLLKKIKVSSKTLFCIYKPKYVMITMKSFSFFIIGRYLDQSIKIIDIEKGHIANILCGDFVCSLAKKNEDIFFTGLQNGQLIEWELFIEKETVTCKSKRFIFAHDTPIYAICINNKHNIIITSAKEKTIYIRKLYDFELLSIILNEEDFITVDIKVSICNFVYILYYNDITKTFILKGYTLNGIHFASSQEGNYNNFELTSNGNILIGYYNEPKMNLLSGGYLNILKEMNIAAQVLGNIEINYVTWFKYQPEQNVILLVFLNGDFQIFKDFKIECDLLE